MRRASIQSASVDRRRRGLLALTGVACFGMRPSHATDVFVSDRPIVLVVPYPSGGPVDAAARVVAAGLSKALNRPVLVENKGGASGLIAAEAVARSRPDGHTLLFGNADIFVLNVLLRKQVRYDPFRSFDPIASVGEMPLALVARSGLAASTLAEVLRLARAQPGRLTYGSWGVGSLGHLAGVMMEGTGGVSMVHVPFLGGAAAQGQLLANEIDLLVVQVPFGLAMQDQGRLRILGLTSSSRSRLCPAVPTLQEEGLERFAAEQWLALFAPAGVPAVRRQALTVAMLTALGEPDIREALLKVGIDAKEGGPDLVTGLVRDGLRRWKPIVKQHHIQID